eukprot:s1398_g3.t1
MQLGFVYEVVLPPSWNCCWCGELLPSGFEDAALITYPASHYRECPLVIQMATLLMTPVLHKDLPHFDWRSREVIQAAVRRADLRLWQHQAQISDFYGKSFDSLAQCGLQMLNDLDSRHGGSSMSTLYQMGMDSVDKIWGNLLSKEQMQSLGVTASEPSPGSNKRHKANPAGKRDRRSRGSSNNTDNKDQEEIVQTLTRLILRQEDSLNTLLQEAEFLVTEELYVDCVKYHLIKDNKDRTMPYLRWNPQKNQLEPTKTPGLPILEVQRSLTNVLRLMEDSRVTLRFHALQKQVEDPSNDKPSDTGDMARAGPLVLPLHLAAHPDPSSTSVLASTTFGQSLAEGTVKFLTVRIFLNSSGKACPVNSVIACLAWMMLLSDGFEGSMWRFGYELMRNVTLHSCVPLELFQHDPFKWLLLGNWSIERFLRVQ